MKILVLDVENSVQFIEEIDEDGKKTKVIDNSPYNPKNKLVAVGWRKIRNGHILAYHHSVYSHNDTANSDDPRALREALLWADIVVGHNIKYDLMWLEACGFPVSHLKVYDTMIGEYILARGVRTALSLEATAIRRNVTHKKSELTDHYFKNEIGFEAIPLPIVEEYLEADVLSTAEIFIDQIGEWIKEKNKTLWNIVILMNEMLLFLAEIEKNGIKIDKEKLAEIEADYKRELQQLESDLESIARQVLGDTPFSLTSPLDISKIVYSREVVNPQLHKTIFNLGKDPLTGKAKYPPYMTPAAFSAAVRQTTRIIKKTKASQCPVCYGKGYIRKTKKDGTLFKKDNKCVKCDTRGFILTETNETAGLKLVPESSYDASVHGFSVSKEQFDRLIRQAEVSGKDLAVEFLTKKKRLNAVNTYLNSFVGGIQRWTREDGILHPWFNQTVARTGRLSSSHPNFQNQPKERKFPIRQCVISRFENGVITECDFSGLEFVIAGELSRDPQIISDILGGKDIHRQTASIVLQKKPEEITKDERNEVKPYTFAPLYGGQGASEPDHIKRYFREFFNIYERHGEWQVEQMESILKTGVIRTPSGREYAFPGTKRLKNGRTTNSTAIVNYPVQGFATGDIVPLACIRALRKFRELNLRSVLILTVHDSIVADTHPEEKQIVADVFKWATTGCVEEIKERWGHEMVLPLKSETSQGTDWMNLESVH
jgi:DNA polymerase I-like protein with 3'-5' exonuclease and polymerase domains